MMNMKTKETTMQCQENQREQDPEKKQKQQQQHQSHMQDHQNPEASEGSQEQFKFASLSLICLNADCVVSFCQLPMG